MEHNQTAEKTVVRQVGFRVDGDWLADFARTRLEEGRWDAGLNMLVDSLGGLTHDQAIAILKGEATLTGNSSTGINYKKLSPKGKVAKRMQEIMNRMYGNLFRISDKVWRPYAVVSGWNRDDWHFACNHKGPYNTLNVNDDKHGGALRSLYYANDPSRDLLVRIPERLYSGNRVIADVLCEEFTGSLPFWYKVPTNIDAVNFVDEVVERNGFGWDGLELRGAYLVRGEEATNDTVDTKGRETDPDAGESIQEAAEEVEELPANGTFPDTHPTKKMVDEEGRALLVQTLDMVDAFFAGEAVTDFSELNRCDVAFEKIIDRLSRHLKEDEWERVDKYRALFETNRERILAARVAAQADERGGWIEIPLLTKDDKPYGPRPTLRVPLNPFLIWTFRANFNFEENGIDLKWDYVAGSGYKMIGDDPAHTDWMLGAGVPLKDTYDHDENSLGDIVRHATYLYKDVLIKKYTNRQFTVLAGNKKRTYAYGDICHPKPGERVAPGSIAVVPNAGPDYQFAMETANMESADGKRGLIICETGGKLAHLAKVAREYNCVVLMIPDALKMYRDGQRVWIDLENGTIEHRVF